MNCEHALELMLEADPAELRRGGDDRGVSSRYPDYLGSAADSHSPLVEHLATCQRCAAVAAALATEMDQLDRGIAAFADSGDADAAADRALAERFSDPDSPEPTAVSTLAPGRNLTQARADGEAAAGAQLGPAASHGNGTWPRWTWAPLAAAAALAALLLARQSDSPQVGTEPGSGTEAAAEAARTEARFAVETPPGRNAAVMKTANPDITVVWLY